MPFKMFKRLGLEIVNYKNLVLLEALKYKKYA
jgi:hypothetical protein